ARNGNPGAAELVRSAAQLGSVVVLAALDTPTGLDGLLAVTTIDARCGRQQAAAAGPTAQALDLLGGGDGRGADLGSCLGEGDVEQCWQAAARLPPGSCPRGVVGPCLSFGDAILGPIHGPDRVLLLRGRQVEEKHPVPAFGPGELRRQL